MLANLVYAGAHGKTDALAGSGWMHIAFIAATAALGGLLFGYERRFISPP
jgi:hypothetical protein